MSYRYDPPVVLLLSCIVLGRGGGVWVNRLLRPRTLLRMSWPMVVVRVELPVPPAEKEKEEKAEKEEEGCVDVVAAVAMVVVGAAAVAGTSISKSRGDS